MGLQSSLLIPETPSRAQWALARSGAKHTLQGHRRPRHLMASLPRHAWTLPRDGTGVGRRVSLTAYPQELSPILSLVWGRLFQVGSWKPRRLLVLVRHQPPAYARERDGRGALAPAARWDPRGRRVCPCNRRQPTCGASAHLRGVVAAHPGPPGPERGRAGPACPGC